MTTLETAVNIITWHFKTALLDDGQAGALFVVPPKGSRHLEDGLEVLSPCSFVSRVAGLFDRRGVFAERLPTTRVRTALNTSG